ncbi:hypothetical protein FHU36_001672 [Nonomuraea muscovyensis]|uniref:Uncharacterized protein n=1 Tax=Nonomuraea muscovyensis TaxID=1124761 RepID=A0A7X0BYS2_9ACTN|nr:hypothetical protein [Nonomuraea muscovyensis]MBB6345163.1 hypothetical protein [Nonomuraea muscovyensis]
MKICLTLILAATVAIIPGCGNYDDTAFRKALDECYKKDALDSKQLAGEVGPLLAPDVRLTLGESSACDSEPEGGASIAYDLDSNVPPNKVLEKFHSAGWADLPLPSDTCGACVARVGKKVGSRSIEAMVQEFNDGTLMLEAMFYN